VSRSRLLVVAALLVALGSLGAWRLAGVGDAYLVARLAAAAIATAVAVHLLGRIPGAGRSAGAAPDELEILWRRGHERSRVPDPPERQRLGRLVRLAVASADYAHGRLRPLLRDLADARFDAAYGTHPDRDPRAAERLGAAAWSWVRPDRPEPVDRHARGPGTDELDAVVTAIESIGSPTGEVA
jgi:hypothetical protein